MSDTMSTVRIAFIGDPESLLAAYDQAAGASNEMATVLSSKAEEASASLDGTSSSVEQLQLKLEGVAPVADEAADAAKGIGTSTDESAKVSVSAIGKIGAALEALGGKFGIVGEAAEKMGASISESAKASDVSLEETGAVASGLGDTLKGVGKGTVLALAVAAAASVDFADKFDNAQAIVKQDLEDTGASWGKEQGAIEAAEKSMAKYGDNSTQVATALGPLIVATGSVGTATKTLSLAADLAAQKHISLADATSTLTKLYAGSNRALTQLGINLDIGSGKLKAIDTATRSVATAQLTLKDTQAKVADGQLKGLAATQALTTAHNTLSNAEHTLHMDQTAVSTSLDALQKRMKGDASAAANTLAGKLEADKASLHNVFTEIGEKLIPILTDAVTYISNVVNWFDRHRAAAVAVAAVIGGVLVAGIVAFIAATVAMIATNVALAASFVASAASAVAAGAAMAAAWAVAAAPVILIVAAVAAVGVAIYELVTHWTQVWGAIKTAASAAWAFIKGVFDDAVNFIKNNWETVLEIITGPVGAAIAVWQHFHDQIIGVFKDIWSTITGVFSSAGTWLYNVGGAIIDGLLHGLESSVGKVTDFLKNSVVGAIKKIPVIGGLIGSPSPYFTEVGKAIPEGLVNGLMSGASNVNGAVQSMVAGVTPALGAGLSSVQITPAAASAAALGGGSSTPVPATIVLQLGTQEVATALIPDIRTLLYQQKRGTVTMELG